MVKGDFMKKFLLIFVMLIICYLSNTPQLRVIEPMTWFNKPEYEENVTNLSFVRETNNVFYTPYSKEDFVQHDFLLHKASHVLFYSIFAYLLYMNLTIRKFKYITTWLIVTIFAITDEIHQYFVVGRSGRLYDVVLDSTAALLVLLVVYGCQTWRKKRENHMLKQ